MCPVPVLIQIERERVTLVGSGRDYDEIVERMVRIIERHEERYNRHS